MAPPSKSMAHRLLISAALADGISTVRGISDCEDVRATLDCLSALGVKFTEDGDTVTVHGIDPRKATPTSQLCARESGSTLRFIIPIALLSGKTTMFSGAGRLMSRPMTVYEDICRELGLAFIADGESITVRGPLTGGTYTVLGNISSQFISGLLFALPCLPDNSRIKIIPPLESRSYIDLTISALSCFGVKAVWEDDYTIFISGNQRYTPTDITVEGDYSGAAFPDALNLFGGEVEVLGLDPESIQGDRVYKKYFELLKLGTPTIHIGDCPDLGPILFAIAAAKCGGIFSGTERLRLKESDRIAAMAEELSKFGTALSVYDDKVVVYPADFKKPTEPIMSHGDHRIVMAMAVLLTTVGGVIEGAEAVKKSYPSFFSDLSMLGIEVEEYDV
ncbi:MAG: 3-phosphoshikimate 1-carboxyvinyltransferase [Clostridia bacterium]|nr:3-phosphoshikimate 1-carboxyvinyltransferase [Clostridia bacterium]